MEKYDNMSNIQRSINISNDIAENKLIEVTDSIF